MMRRYHVLFWILLEYTATANAHTFATPYTLPVPFWMYAYGAAAALVLSFVVVGLVSGKRVNNGVMSSIASPSTNSASAWQSSAIRLLRAVSLFLLGLTIATGLVGTQNPFTNFNMTFFWIVFVLGFTYLTAIIGDVYRFINPWRVLCEWLQTLWPNLFKGRCTYPASWGYYPALLLYMAFIWLELFGHTKPFTLSLALIVYTAINLAGAWLFGLQAWLRHGEFFGLFLRLVGMMAPVVYGEVVDARGKSRVRARLRMPFVGLLEERAEHVSLVVFILFMLSSTAYDGMHETAPWSQLFWGGMYPLIDPLVQSSSSQPYVLAANIYNQWQVIALLFSPLVYLGSYLIFLWLTKALTGSRESLLQLTMRFAHSLLPIALVYHITHYYTLVLSQGVQIISQISDPFGFGWNLFGTASESLAPILIDANIIWHTQVGFILIGHIISVYLAHVEALKIFDNGFRAMVSQLPMLLLMVGLTAAGLWILSLPLGT